MADRSGDNAKINTLLEYYILAILSHHGKLSGIEVKTKIRDKLSLDVKHSSFYNTMRRLRARHHLTSEVTDPKTLNRTGAWPTIWDIDELGVSALRGERERIREADPTLT